MASSNGNDITLKMGIDTTDARNAILTFSAYADKGFKSTNTRVQGMANSLTRVVQNLKTTTDKMREMENTKVPTDLYKQLTKDVETLGKSYTKAKSELDKFKNTQMPTQEYSELQDRMTFLKTEITNTQKALKTFQQTPIFTSTVNEVNRLQRQLAQAEATVVDFERSGATTGQAYSVAVNRVNELTTALRTAQDRQQYLIQNGQQFQNQASYDRHITMLNIYKRSLEQAESDLQELINTGKAYANTPEYNAKIEEVKRLRNQYLDTIEAKAKLERSGLATQSLAQQNPTAYNSLENRYANLYRQGTLIANNMDNITTKTNKWSNVLSSVKSMWSNLNSKVRESSREHSNASKSVSSFSKNHNNSFKSMITMVLKYVFGIRSIFLLYKKIRTTISTGLTEMAKQFSDVADDVNTLKNSWSGFKASLVSAFQPIFSYVVPALTTLINYLTSAMNALANFFALLTGQSYYYKAKKGNEDVAKSVASTGSAAEEANEELAEYDDLIVIDQDTDSGGSGGSGSDTSDAWNWEKVETEAVSLDEKLTNVWKKFKESWEKNGQTVIDNAKKAFNNIKTLAKTVANTLYDVFMSDTGTTWLDSIYNMLNSILTLIGSIAQAWIVAWNRNNAGYNFITSIFNLLTRINSIIATITSDFAKAFSSETGYNTLNSFLVLATSIVNTITSIATSFENAWKKDGSGYAYVESIFNMLKSISELITTISDSFRKAWESDGTGEAIIGNIITLLTNINTIISNITSNFKTAWEEGGKGDEIMETILDIVERISTFLVDISESTKEWSASLDFNPVLESVSGLLESIEGIIDTILSIATEIWDNFILPLSKKITESTLPDVLDTISGLLDDIKGVLDTIPWEDIVSKAEEFVELQLDDTMTKLKNAIQGFSAEVKILVSMAEKVEKFWSYFKTQPEYEFLVDVKNNLKEINDVLKTFGAGFNFSFASHFPGIGKFVENISNLYDILSKLWDLISGKAWEEEGGAIWDGIKKGYDDSVDWDASSVSTFDILKLALKYVFGIGSPAKNMYESGENIFLGIVEGFKNMFTKDNITNAISTLKDKFVSAITDKFKDFKLTDIVEGIGDVAVNITTTFKGAITQLTDWTNFDDTLDTIKTSYKDMKAKLKTTLEGEIQKLADLTDLDDKWKKLKDDWADKEAKLKAYVGGQLTKVTDIDSWKDKFGLLKENWTDAKATLSAYVGGAISDVQELTGADGKSGWYGIITKLKGAWTGSDATFTTKADTHETDEAISDGGSFKKATDIWQNQTATFSATTDTPEELEEKVKKLAETWSKYDAEATFTVNTPDDAIQNAKNTIADLYNCWTSYDGTQASFNVAVNGSSNLSTAFAKLVADINSAIKQAGGTTSIDSSKYTKYFLARGGIVSGATNFVAGEDGAEAVIPLERNLGWMDKMATSISDKLATVALPAIVQGSVLPATESFMSKNSVTDKNDQVVSLLQQLIEVMTTNEDSNNAPIMLQLDGRTIAQAVWDENNKKYKQTGVRYAI